MRPNPLRSYTTLLNDPADDCESVSPSERAACFDSFSPSDPGPHSTSRYSQFASVRSAASPESASHCIHVLCSSPTVSSLSTGRLRRHRAMNSSVSLDVSDGGGKSPPLLINSACSMKPLAPSKGGEPRSASSTMIPTLHTSLLASYASPFKR